MLKHLELQQLPSSQNSYYVFLNELKHILRVLSSSYGMIAPHLAVPPQEIIVCLGVLSVSNKYICEHSYTANACT